MGGGGDRRGEGGVGREGEVRGEVRGEEWRDGEGRAGKKGREGRGGGRGGDGRGREEVKTNQHRTPLIGIPYMYTSIWYMVYVICYNYYLYNYYYGINTLSI